MQSGTTQKGEAPRGGLYFLRVVDRRLLKRVLPMYPVHCVTHVSGPDPKKVEPRAGLEPATCRLRIGCSTTELPRLFNNLRDVLTAFCVVLALFETRSIAS